MPTKGTEEEEKKEAEKKKRGIGGSSERSWTFWKTSKFLLYRSHIKN